MSRTLNGQAPAMGLSIAFHAAAIVGAGLGAHHAAPRDGAPMEVFVESEPAPFVPPPAEVPVANDPPASTPALKGAAVRHEPVAVHAVAATGPSPAPEAPPADGLHAMASDDALPHFTIATSTSSSAGGTLAKTAGAATRLEGSENDAAPYTEDAVDVPARAARKVAPTYPVQAQSGGLEATVKLEIVLSSAGVVESIHAVNHPGHGFEEEAIAAAWRTSFTPAMKRGRAVPVRVLWTVDFQLQ